jgi:outer membrane lipoprotein-sorting protein
LPVIVATRGGGRPPGSVGMLLERVRESAATPFQGLAESSGTLNVPGASTFSDEADLLGGTNRLRVWYAGPRRYRVDTLSVGGERDLYRDGDVTWAWDSDRRTAVRSTGVTGFPLPAASDVTPPELGRRLLADVDPARARAGTTRRIAGRPASGIVVEPRDPRSLVGRVSVWVDDASGLPLRVEVERIGAARPAFRAGFLDLTFAPPGAAELSFTPSRDPTADVSDDPGQADMRRAPYRLPSRLAGLARRGDASPYVTTYGDGFALLSVASVSLETARGLRSRIDTPQRPPLSGAFGNASVVSSPLLTGLVLATPDRGWLLAGTVPQGVLTAAASELVLHPPPGVGP